MPVYEDLNRVHDDQQRISAMLLRATPSQFPQRSDRCVKIGLLNIMGEGAFQATERQFVSLLKSACKDISIELSFYTLPSLQRPGANRTGGERYSSVQALWNKRLDGLIVTGREPSTEKVRDEPYWDSFTEVVAWARENTYSTMWSCLAAHAAILHMDDIDRCRSNRKHFGIYDCERVSNHSLTAGVSPRFRSPHSRWNGLAEAELAARGYRVLTRSADAGVDIFIKEENSLFVFLQGHPEYESHTLLREYRRDVGRFLRCETNAYPSLPRDYFDPSTASALNGLRDKALSCRSTEFVVQLTSTLERIEVENTWRATAVHLYSNWLGYLCDCKNARRQDGFEDSACAAS